MSSPTPRQAAAPPPSHLAIALLTLLLSSTLITSCRSNICVDESPTGFATFRQNTWSSYCEQLESRIREPLNYPLIELTEFFSDYPERSESIRTKLAGFPEPERCFDSNKAQLELRSLKSCLNDVTETEALIQQAWLIRAEPWLAEYRDRVRKLELSLADASLQTDYIEQKIQQKSQASSPIDTQPLIDYTTLLNSLQSEIGAIDRAKDDYERLAGASMAYTEFNGFIEANIAEKVGLLLEDHEKNRFAIARLRNTERYFNFASKSVGVVCPEGPKARTEQKVAGDKLNTSIKELRAGPVIHISKPIEKTKADDGAETEVFEGFICGSRGPDNQFEKRLRLCARYPFKITRAKPAKERKWKDWEVASFEEGDADQGVDCYMMLDE